MEAKSKDIIAVFASRNGVKTGNKIEKGKTFTYDELVGTWLRLPDNTWVNAGAQWQYIELLPNIPPPPTDAPKLLWNIQFYSDGKLVINGKPYP